MPIVNEGFRHDPMVPLHSSIGNFNRTTIIKEVDHWLDTHPEATTTVEDGSITTAKLADHAVTAAKVMPKSLGDNELADGCVTTPIIHDEAVTEDKIAVDAVTTGRVADKAITTDKLADFCIVGDKVANRSITAEKLAHDAIPVMSTDVVGVAKVGAGLTMNGDALELDGSGDIATAVQSWLDAHPEATTTVQDGAVTTAKLADGAVTMAKVGGDLAERFEETYNLNPYDAGRYKGDASTGTISAASNLFIGMPDMIECLPSTRYALSCRGISGPNNSGTVYWNFYQADKTFITSGHATNGTKEWVVETPANCEYIYVWYYGGSGLTMTSESAIQVNVGNVALAYVPHLTSIDEIERVDLAHIIPSWFDEIPLKFCRRKPNYSSSYLSRAICMYVPVKAGSVVEFHPVGTVCSWGITAWSSPHYDMRQSYYAWANQSGDLFNTPWMCRDRYVVPQDCYLMISCRTNGDGSNIVLSDAQASFSLYGPKLNDIIDLNQDAIKMISQARKQATNKKVLTLTHFSDIHGDPYQLSRLIDFSDHVGVDDILHTGDSMLDSYDEHVKQHDGTVTTTLTGFTWWEFAHAGKVLNCIGNHDMKLEDEPWVGANNQPTTADAYNRYFAPYWADWGVTWGDPVTPSNALYYYKDYNDDESGSGIRLIVLDENSRSDSSKAAYQATQVSWLQTVLADAITNDLAVIIAQHYQLKLSDTPQVDCSFMSERWVTSDGNSIAQDFQDAVATFVANGGEFVCWLAGHTHRDLVQAKDGHLLISCDTGSSMYDNTLTYSDLRRDVDDETCDCFNVITFDRNEKRIDIVRVGADRNYHMRPRKCISFDYSTCSVIYDNA